MSHPGSERLYSRRKNSRNGNHFLPDSDTLTDTLIGTTASGDSDRVHLFCSQFRCTCANHTHSAIGSQRWEVPYTTSGRQSRQKADLDCWTAFVFACRQPSHTTSHFTRRSFCFSDYFSRRTMSEGTGEKKVSFELSALCLRMASMNMLIVVIS